MTARARAEPAGDTSLENVMLGERYVVGKALGAGGMATVYVACADVAPIASTLSSTRRPSAVSPPRAAAPWEWEMAGETGTSALRKDGGLGVGRPARASRFGPCAPLRWRRRIARPMEEVPWSP